MKLTSYAPSTFELECEARLQKGELSLHYRWQDQLDLPAPHEQVGARKIGLWEGVCFEFFLKPLDDSGAYYEINLAPNGDWNSFVFTSYRSSPLTECQELVCSNFRLSPQELQVTFKLAPALAPQSFKANACAIMPQLKDRARFMAFAHAKDRPDFHDQSTFIYYLS